MGLFGYVYMVFYKSSTSWLIVNAALYMLFELCNQWLKKCRSVACTSIEMTIFTLLLYKVDHYSLPFLYYAAKMVMIII